MAKFAKLGVISLTGLWYQFFFFFFEHHFYFPAQLVGFYPQRSSGQAVVTGVVPSPPGTCLQYFSGMGSAFPLLVDFHRMLRTQALALSANQCLCKKKSLRVYALGEKWTHEIDFSRHEDNPPSHRGRRQLLSVLLLFAMLHYRL